MIPPIKSPNPIGRRIDKLIVEIADRYISYNPSIISITVLLTPGITIPADIRAPARIKYELEFIFVIIFSELSKATRYKLKENVISKHKTCVNENFLILACFITRLILPKY